MTDSNRDGPLPPYGTAIHEAVASGDLAAMKKVSKEAKAYLRQTKEIKAARKRLKAEIRKLENG